MDYNTIMM